MQTPLESLRALCAKEEFFANTLESDIETHRRVGYVLDSDDLFLMWRRVNLAWGIQDLRNPALVDPQGTLAWVWAAAHDFKKAARLALELCPWISEIGFDRNGFPKLITAASLRRRLAI